MSAFLFYVGAVVLTVLALRYLIDHFYATSGDVRMGLFMVLVFLIYMLLGDLFKPRPPKKNAA